jgi:biopolymer transport protein ExbD
MSAPTKRHVPLLLGYNKSKASVRKNKKVEVQLTSMIDMFTILVVFLLQSYSADGMIVSLSDALTLPKSNAESPVELKLEIQVNTSVIVVDGDPIVAVDNELLSTGNSIPSLVTRLRDHMEYNRRLSSTLTEEDMMINIQGDIAVPAILLQRVMASCSEAGFSTQNLEVIKIEGGGNPNG